MPLQDILEEMMRNSSQGSGFGGSNGQNNFGAGNTPPFGGGPNHSPKREPPSQKPAKGTPVSRQLISLLVTLVFGAVYFYVRIPALNFQTKDIYWFIFWLCLVYCFCMIILRGFRAESAGKYIPYIRKKLSVPFYIVVAMAAVIIVGSVSGWVIFRAHAYSELIPVREGDFAVEVAELSWNQIPMLDADSANNLANRKLGELSDLVSQFTVSTSSAQINYNNKPVRVTYLNYGNIFKWLNNLQAGIPAYMIVDMVTQEVDVIRLEEGIRYSPSEFFNRDLYRHLRFNYPTLIFDDVNFEIDDQGTPYWVASVIRKTIGLFGGADVAGAVLVNAVNGECTYYNIGEIPNWIDRVCSADLVIQQYNYYGRYLNGFINSLFGQNQCTVTTSGYNYIAQDDDVWLYTGITSVTGDRGNIGFILVNQRTKDARYYSCAGAEEFSAMSSAEGAVQQYAYESTFPLLLNIGDQPTYFMALKDTAGLVKMYAMVNVQQYQIVATGYSVAECQTSYQQLLLQNGLIETVDPSLVAPEQELLKLSGAVEDIRSATIDGNTWYYLRLSGSELYFAVRQKDNPLTVLLNVGDPVTVSYYAGEEALAEVVTLDIR